MFRREAVITYPNGDFETSISLLLESVDNEINSYIQRKKEIEDLIFMSEATDENLAIFESEEKGFVGKIGQKIIDFFEMIKKKINELTTKFRSLFKKKENSSDAELKRAMENHPELAMSFYDGIRNGNIKIADYKDIDSLLNTVEKLAKDMESGKIDHKTFSDKVDDALAAVEKKVKPVANILGAVTSITGAITGLCFLRKSFIKQAQDYEPVMNKYNSRVEEIMVNMANDAEKNVKDYQANAKKPEGMKDKNVTLNKSTELGMLMKKWNQVSNEVFQHESRILSVLEKIGNFSPSKKINPVHTDKESIMRLSKKGKMVDYKTVHKINNEKNEEERIAAKADAEEKRLNEERMKSDAIRKNKNGGRK